LQRKSLEKSSFAGMCDTLCILFRHNIMRLRLSPILAADRHGRDALDSGPGGIVVAMAISLLLHAMLLLYGARLVGTPRLRAMPAPEPLTVWLRPAPLPQPLPSPPPPLATQPEAPALPAPKSRKPRKDEPANRPAPAPGGMTWVAPATVPEPAPTETPAPAAPKFDMEAARRSARKLASERDPGKAGTPLGQLPEKAIADETPLARQMSRAARGDCKEGIPGGLLAPALLLLDKKDSGCKW
jgi:hypothetical protein